jgi:hypothetical protein
MTDPRFAGRGVPDPGFPDDDGTADPAVVHALQALAAGGGDASTLLRALAGARLLVPVVAVLEEAEVGADGLRHEKTSSMASVTVLAPDGRRALVAFTSTQSLRTWRADARPIAAEAWRVAQATLAEGADVLLVDASGPVPFAVEGAELRALALGADPTLPPHLDDGVASAVASVCAGEPSVLEAWLEAGDPKGVRVVVVVDDTIPIEDFRALVPRLNGALAAAPVLRARAEALQVALVPPSMPPASGVVAFRRG